MNEKYIVALDQGTSSCRAFAINQKGEVQACKHKVFSPQRPAKGKSEYNATQLLKVQLEVLHALLDEIGPDQVASLGVCSQRSSIVLWDKKTGHAVAPVLTWEDGRAVQESAQVSLTQEQVHKQTGLFNTPYFSAPKIAWCLKNCPAAAQAAQAGTLLAAPIASYFIWHLTKGTVFATDPTLAQRTLLWNIQTRQWDESLCQAFGVPFSCLPVVYSSATDYGSHLYKGVNIPIRTCVADQQAAAIYQGLSAGKTSINYGTGAFVLHHTGSKLTILPGMLSSVTATTQPAQQNFLLEGPVFAAGSVLQWLQQVKGLSFNVEQIDSICAQAQNPVLFLPALGGLGAPYWDYTVGPISQNVTQQTSVADWVSGTLSGIAGLVADIIYYLHLNGCKIADPVYVSGGLGQSAYLLQRQADLLQKTLRFHVQTENTVLGTALLTAKFLGYPMQVWKNIARTISPRITPQQTRQEYENWQKFVQNCRK